MIEIKVKNLISARFLFLLRDLNSILFFMIFLFQTPLWPHGLRVFSGRYTPKEK